MRKLIFGLFLVASALVLAQVPIYTKSPISTPFDAASPGPIGGTTPAAGSFTTGTFSSTVTLSGTAANIATGSNFISNGGTDAGVSLDSNNKLTVTPASNSTGIETTVNHDTISGLKVTNSSAGTSASAGFVMVNNTPVTSYWAVGSSARASYGPIGPNVTYAYTNHAGGMAFFVDADGPMVFTTNTTTPVERMRISGGTSLITMNTALNVQGNYQNNGKLMVSATAPTIGAGLCTSPSVSASSGTAAFAITVGTSCTGVSTGTLTMPAATTGWVCHFVNVTSPASFVVSQTGGATNTVTLTNYSRTTGLATDFTASESIRAMCFAY